MYDIILHIKRKGLEMISEGVGDRNDATHEFTIKYSDFFKA